MLNFVNLILVFCEFKGGWFEKKKGMLFLFVIIGINF